MYTMKDWERDGSFAAVPGQEVEEEIYYDFYNGMPLHNMKRETFGRFIRLDEVFQTSEPHGCNSQGLTYATFGRIGNKYHFLGYLN